MYLREVAGDKLFSRQAELILNALDKLWMPHPSPGYYVIPALDTIYRTKGSNCILGYRYFDHRLWQSRSIARSAVTLWQGRLVFGATAPTLLTEFQTELTAILIITKVYGPEYCAAILDLIPKFPYRRILESEPHVCGKLLVVAWLTSGNARIPTTTEDLISLVQAHGPQKIHPDEYFTLVQKAQDALYSLMSEWDDLSTIGHTMVSDRG